MLKRSKLLIALLVVTVVCASIGFAVVNDELTVTGDFKIDVDNIEADFDADVQFVSASITAATHTDVMDSDVSVTQDNVDQITFDIPATALIQVNDYIEITAVVSNANTMDAVISLNTASATLHEVVGVTMTTTTIDAGESGNVVIRLTLNDIPETSIGIDTEATYTITLDVASATPTE